MECIKTHSTPNRSVAADQIERDELLVLAAKAGSISAFEELHNLYKQKVFHVIVRITKNREDAEDALQEAFAKAYAGLAQFEGRSLFSTWLTRIAINASLMLVRKRRAQEDCFPHSSLAYREEHPEYSFPDEGPSPEQRFQELQRQLRLMKAIRRLNPSLRKLVEIRMREECTLKEAARILDISEAAAKSRLYRARLRLTSSHGYRNL